MACQDRSIVNQELKLASGLIYCQRVRDDLPAKNLTEDEFPFVVAQDRNVINFAMETFTHSFLEGARHCFVNYDSTST